MNVLRKRTALSLGYLALVGSVVGARAFSMSPILACANRLNSLGDLFSKKDRVALSLLRREFSKEGAVPIDTSHWLTEDLRSDLLSVLAGERQADTISFYPSLPTDPNELGWVYSSSASMRLGFSSWGNPGPFQGPVDDLRELVCALDRGARALFCEISSPQETELLCLDYGNLVWQMRPIHADKWHIHKGIREYLRFGIALLGPGSGYIRDGKPVWVAENQALFFSGGERPPATIHRSPDFESYTEGPRIFAFINYSLCSSSKKLPIDQTLLQDSPEN